MLCRLAGEGACESSPEAVGCLSLGDDALIADEKVAVKQS